MSENMFEGFESMEFEEMVNSPTNSNLLDSLPGSPIETVPSSVDSAEEIISINGANTEEEIEEGESVEDEEQTEKQASSKVMEKDGKKVDLKKTDISKTDDNREMKEDEESTSGKMKEDDFEEEEEEEDEEALQNEEEPASDSVKRDIACWVCHLECVDFGCSLCSRTFHIVCMEEGTAGGGKDWICPVCEKVSDAECVDTATNLPEFVSQELLCCMLKRAIQVCKPRISDLFHYPVNVTLFPSYPNFVVNPMDLSTLETNCVELKYSSTTAFVGDVEYIHHNSCVFNSTQSPISKLAKRALNLLKQEVELIELCPSCYANCLVSNGFVQLCVDPHEPVWAKMSGYPYWPAKVIREKSMQVEVQFFGDHDRAWIPKSKVLRMSQKIPENPKHNQIAFDISMKELKFYVENLQMVTNFSLSEHRTSFTGVNKISRVQSSDKLNRLDSFDYAFEDSKIVVKTENITPESEVDETAEKVQRPTRDSQKTCKDTLRPRRESPVKSPIKDASNDASKSSKETPKRTNEDSEKSTEDAVDQQEGSDSEKEKGLEKPPEVVVSEGKEVDIEQIQIKEEPQDYVDDSTKTLSVTNDSTFMEPKSPSKTPMKVKPTVALTSTPNLSDTKPVPQAFQSQDPEVDNFDIRFHFLSNLNSSTFIRTASNYLEKDWISDSEEGSTNHVTKAQLNRIVDTVQQRFAKTNKLPFGDQIKKTPHIVPAPLKLMPNSSANRFAPSIKPPSNVPLPVPTLHPPVFKRPPNNPYEFLDNPGVMLPPANMLNMQIQGTLQPISPILTPNDPPVTFLPPELQLAPRAPLIPFSSANTDHFQYQSVTQVNKLPMPPPNFSGPPPNATNDMMGFNPQRKRLSDEPLAPSSCSVPVSSRPRLEVKGTPNIEAQMQGSITEAKIVDKVTEKLSDSLQSMVESFLSNRMMDSRGNSDARSCKSQGATRKTASGQSQDDESSRNDADSSKEQELLARIEQLEGELAEVKRQRKEEVLELKNCYEYLLAEVKLSSEQAFKHETDSLLQEAIEQCKSRQWCAICRKEAFYSCCWNVSYCSTDCQKLHWADHSAVCTHVNNIPPSPSSAILQQQQQTPSLQFPNITFAIPTVTTPGSAPKNMKTSNLLPLQSQNNASLFQTVEQQPPTVCFLQSPFNQSDCPNLIQSQSRPGSLQKSPPSQVIQSGPQRTKTPIFNSHQKLTPKIQNVVSLAHPR